MKIASFTLLFFVKQLIITNSLFGISHEQITVKEELNIPFLSNIIHKQYINVKKKFYYYT